MTARSARPRIQVLPDHVANQIAAGEVVERPASVVKELVENALDAGARTIRTSIERGGKGRISVADDGCGMEREDALKCLDRHATSKIRDAGDLSEIRTLGFRGEALPSIAAVSRLVLETCAQGRDSGTRLRVVAGRLQGFEDVARRPGTTVDVRNLFLNTPVRARFLRDVGVETRAVFETLYGLALANLDVRFVLEVGGKVHVDLSRRADLLDRVRSIWKDAGDAGLIPVSAREDGHSVSGLIQRPDRARPGFRRVRLFVGGRPFRDPGVVAAADRGYRTTVAPGTRPWMFLFLDVPPGRVDVNVHPGKAEVRFRNPRRVEAFVERAVRGALEGADAAAAWGRSPSTAPERADERADARAPSLSGADNGAPGSRSGSRERDAGRVAQMGLFEPVGADESRPGRAAGERGAPTSVPRPRLLQIHNSFILAETRDGLIIVDQHAAHERVLYERIVADFEAAGSEAQRLLFPISIHLAPPEAEMVDAVSDALSRLGFEISRLAADVVLVQSAPRPHRYFDAERCVREMIRELTRGSDLMRAARNQNERVAMSFACKAAIKAGQPLAPDEMQELFDQLFGTELPYHDVHGRPTVVRLGLGELHRKFGRS